MSVNPEMAEESIAFCRICCTDADEKERKMTELKQTIKKILKENVEELEGVELTDDLPLVSGGFMDSFDIVNLIEIFEQDLGIEIDLQNIEIEQFDNIASICSMIEGQ